MTNDMRARPFDINPAVPHHLVRKVTVFRKTHSIHLAAATIVLSAAMMRVRVGEDDVDAARVDALTSARPLVPVVVPAHHIFYGVRILIAIIDARILPVVERTFAIFVKGRRELVPVFAQGLVARILHSPEWLRCALVDVEHLAAVFSNAAIEHLTAA